MSQNIAELPFTVIPVQPPSFIRGRPRLSLKEALHRAANPKPVQFYESINDQKNFSRDSRSFGFSDTVLETVYIKLPHTPVILHQFLEQFREPISRAIKEHYGYKLADNCGEFISVNISQKDLKPGDVSTFPGRHIDIDYEDIFADRMTQRDLYILSDCFPTIFVNGGFNLARIVDYVHSASTPQERATFISKPVNRESYRRIYEETKHISVRALQPYEIARYDDFQLHEAQMATHACRRTLLNVNIFAPYGSTLTPSQPLNNGRLTDYLDNPEKVLKAKNMRILVP